MAVRNTAIGLALSLLLCPSLALGQMLDLPVPPNDFVGTPFRGVAIGQTRAEVEAALAELGKRCATDSDFPATGPGDIPPSMNGNSSAPCWILEIADPVPKESLAGNRIASAMLRVPYHAISFSEDRATAVVVDADFFNSAGVDMMVFAQSLIDNYDLPQGMQRRSDGGWMGFTSKGEQVGVGQILGAPFLTVVMGAGRPSFD